MSGDLIYDNDSGIIKGATDSIFSTAKILVTFDFENENGNEKKNSKNSKNFKNSIISKPIQNGNWYFEVTLLTSGLMQIGWIRESFHCDSKSGDGVGDTSDSW